MSEPRKQPNLTTKLAAALLALEDIPYSDAKLMTADQIISLYHFDHNIRHADGGTIDFWNLTPRLIVPHREKTAKVDIPAIAKGKRIRRKMADHDFQMSAKKGIVTLTFSPKPKSKIKSRGFDKTRTRRFNGTVERRS